MEVHHHTHTPRKKWSHYFWEFLMLFLAVFCGFLAENLREHYVERRRESQFMVSMSKDLQTDMMNFAGMVHVFTDIQNHIDSLVPLLEDHENMDLRALSIYEHAVWIHNYYKAAYADRTISQLKSSGNFRLIRNKQISDGLIEYDAIIKNNIEEMQNNYIYQQKEKMINRHNDILKLSVIKEWFRPGWEYSDKIKFGEIELPSPPYFLTKDKAQIDRFINDLNQYWFSIAWFKENVNRANVKAKFLDSLIKGEYHLN